MAAVASVAGCTAVFGSEEEWIPEEFEDADDTDPEATEDESGLAFAYRRDVIDYWYEDQDADRDKAIISNAGVYAADFDRDGWTDLLFVGGREPELHRNDGGEFIKSDELPSVDGSIRAAHWFDANGSGYPDLLLLGDDMAPLLCWNERGTFRADEDAFDVELDVPMGATSADYTGNGDLDLFIFQNGDWEKGLPDGTPRYDADLNDDNGNPDYLFRNDGGTFELVDDAGIEGTRWTLAASFIDLTGDGTPDIHAGNDFNYDVIYLNQGDGTFEQHVLPEETNRHAMSSEVADLTNNGRPDVFVTNIYYPDWAVSELMPGREVHAGGNNVITSRGDGEFALEERSLGLYEGGWGWDAVVDDFTNSGYPDVIHTTRVMTFSEFDARLSPEEIQRLRVNDYYSLPVVWVQEAPGEYAKRDPQEVGFIEMDSRGIVSLDHDRDGSLDVVISTIDDLTGFTGEYRLFENTADVGNAVQFEVLGADGSLSGAIGAEVTVHHEDHDTTLWIHDRQGFLAQKPHVRHVGIGDAAGVDVTITWPDGAEATVDLDANTLSTITPDGLTEVIRLDA